MNEFIGSKLKSLLEEAKMSIETLAEKSNIPQEQLVEIVNNTTTPSLHITIRICEALDIRVGTLLDGTDIQPISVVRHDEHLACNNSYSTTNRIHTKNLSYQAMTTKPNRSMDPYLIVVSDEELGNDALQSHEGEEFIYIIEGEIEFRYGDKVTKLEKGDTIYFDSLIPHCMKSAVKGGSKILATHYRL